jgi:hypothetical protein
MSIAAGVRCLTCRRIAPEIGDAGYLGAPTLEVSESSTDGWFEPDPIPTFGFFYEGLAAIGLVPYEIALLHEFLHDHAGHRLYIAMDADDPEKWPADVRACEEAGLADGHVEGQELDRERRRRTATGEFVVGHFELSCAPCQAVLRSEAAELLKRTDAMPVSAMAARMFVDRWGAEYHELGSSHGLVGIIDPFEAFLDLLRDFCELHAGHGLHAAVVPAAEDEDG